MEDASQTLLLGAGWYLVFLLSLTVHEAAHAWAALRLGDPTAYHGGQVTLDPIPHMRREPFGTLIMPLISFAISGWMMGWASAPYDPGWANRHPRRAALMALAGPVSNLILAVLAGILIRVGLAAGWFRLPLELRPFTGLLEAADGGAAGGALPLVLSIAFSLNLLLFLFNLIPVPPLDGSAVIQLIMSDSAARSYQEMMSQPMLAIVGLLAAWRVFGYLFWPVYDFAVVHVLFMGLLG